jgi:UDP-N-acetylmuramoyl-L-alanyl-D-glutamate--2,6-diaminopimelate ligase
MIHVFGSAGRRDIGKRQIMGKVASFYDDVIILTSEDPRGEPVENINRDIKKGIIKGKEVYEVPDRRRAISFALSKAEKDDIVIVTGKGHEKSMNLGYGEIEWSDQDVILELLKKHAV